MTAPSSFQLYEGEGPLYAVTVSARADHGTRTLLHTFVYRRQAVVDGMPYGDADNTWVVATPPTRGQADDANYRRSVIRADSVTHRRDGGGEQGDDLTAEAFAMYGPESASSVPVHLARGVDVSPGVLSVILDALRSADRHEVDIHDIKVVVSQLGSLIVRLSSLAEPEARNAATALYTEILKRCSML